MIAICIINIIIPCRCSLSEFWSTGTSVLTVREKKGIPKKYGRPGRRPEKLEWQTVIERLNLPPLIWIGLKSLPNTGVIIPLIYTTSAGLWLGIIILKLCNNNKSLNPCRCSLSVTSVTGKYSDNSETMQMLQFFPFFWMLKKVKFYFEFKEKSQSEYKIN